MLVAMVGTVDSHLQVCPRITGVCMQPPKEKWTNTKTRKNMPLVLYVFAPVLVHVGPAFSQRIVSQGFLPAFVLTLGVFGGYRALLSAEEKHE